MKKNKPIFESTLLAISQVIGISIGVCANGPFDWLVSVMTCLLAPAVMTFYGWRLRQRLALSMADGGPGRAKQYKRSLS